MNSYPGACREAGMANARETISRRLDELDRSMKWLSEELGRNPAYIQQFIERHSPKDLRLEMKLRIAELLDLELAELGVADYDVRQRPSGLNEDAEPYTPPPASLLTRQPSIGYFRVSSDALARHPLRIQKGDILAFDMSPDAVADVRTEQIVVAQLYDKKELLEARTVVREYVRPGLLITNRDSDNEIITLGDENAPYEAHIKGVFKSLIRE